MESYFQCKFELLSTKHYIVCNVELERDFSCSLFIILYFTIINVWFKINVDIFANRNSH